MSYKTQQREILINFLKENHNKNFSVDEISKALENYDISVSAIYRNLCELENDGQVKKISKSGTRKAFYQFVGDDACKGHLHLTCEKCGQTVHLDSDATSTISNELLQNASFSLDEHSTVLIGTCKDCAKCIHKKQ